MQSTNVIDNSLALWLRHQQNRNNSSSIANLPIEVTDFSNESSVIVCSGGPKILVKPDASGMIKCYTEQQWIDKLWSDMRLSTFHYPIIMFNLLIFLFGTTGNVFVCLSVRRNHQLRNVTNYFIVNLAFADFLVILICLPATALWDLYLSWFFGTIPCKLIMFLQDVSISVSVLTLTAISIDRYYAICHPLKFKSSLNQAKKIIAMIWVISLITMSPDLLYLSAKPSQDLIDSGINTVLYSDCDYELSEQSSRLFQFVKTILLYLLPFLLMFCAHYKILQALRIASTMALEELKSLPNFDGLSNGPANYELTSQLIITNNTTPTSTYHEPRDPLAAPIGTGGGGARGCKSRRHVNSGHSLDLKVMPICSSSIWLNNNHHQTAEGESNSRMNNDEPDDNDNNSTTSSGTSTDSRSSGNKRNKSTNNKYEINRDHEIGSGVNINKCNYVTSDNNNNSNLTSEVCPQQVSVNDNLQLPDESGAKLCSPMGTPIGKDTCIRQVRFERQTQTNHQTVASADGEQTCGHRDPTNEPNYNVGEKKEASDMSLVAPLCDRSALNKKSPSSSSEVESLANNKQNQAPPDNISDALSSIIKTPKIKSIANNDHDKCDRVVEIAPSSKAQVRQPHYHSHSFHGVSSSGPRCNDSIKSSTCRSGQNSDQHNMNSISAAASARNQNQIVLTMHNKSRIESRQRAAKMLSAIVIIFGLCYLPVHLINFLRQFIEDIPQNDVTSTISMLAHCVCYLNSAINPIIYNHMNSVFRQEFRKFLSWRPWRKTSSSSSSICSTAQANNLHPQLNNSLSLGFQTRCSDVESADLGQQRVNQQRKSVVELNGKRVTSLGSNYKHQNKNTLTVDNCSTSNARTFNGPSNQLVQGPSEKIDSATSCRGPRASTQIVSRVAGGRQRILHAFKQKQLC